MGSACHTSDWFLLLSRLFSWAVLRFLNCLFLNVQLHKGHMKMVRQAAQAVSLPSSGMGGRSRARPSPESGPALSPGGKIPLLSDVLLFVPHSSAPTGFLSCLSIMVLTTITPVRYPKGCEQSGSPFGKCALRGTAQPNPSSLWLPWVWRRRVSAPCVCRVEMAWHFHLAFPKQGLPLVLLSTHKSLLDGLLLPFVLLSQGLGVLRVAWDPCACSPVLR